MREKEREEGGGKREEGERGEGMRRMCVGYWGRGKDKETETENALHRAFPGAEGRKRFLYFYALFCSYCFNFKIQDRTGYCADPFLFCNILFSYIT